MLTKDEERRIAANIAKLTVGPKGDRDEKIAIIVLTLSAVTSALSYERKFIHPECTE